MFNKWLLLLLLFHVERNLQGEGKSTISQMNLWAPGLGGKSQKIFVQGPGICSLNSRLWYYWLHPMAVAASNPDLVKTGLWSVLWCGSTWRLEIFFQVRWALYRTVEKRNPSCLLSYVTRMKTNPCVFTFCLDLGASSGFFGSNPGFLLTSCVTLGYLFSLELSWL